MARPPTTRRRQFVTAFGAERTAATRALLHAIAAMDLGAGAAAVGG
jgi:hypothetical protein